MPSADVALPVIAAMRAELPRGGLRMSDMADVAHLSPYHFIRVFRQATGLSPGAFQAALRLAEAKRRLTQTDIPVTEVCFDLGYASLGTFVGRFTAAVGVSPTRLRRLCRDIPALTGPLPEPPRSLRPSAQRAVLGEVHAGGIPLGPVFIGLFPAYLPRGLPVAGLTRWGAGPFTLAPVPAGTHALMAAACPEAADLSRALMFGEGLLVGGLAGVRTVDRPVGPLYLHLRPRQPLDPPILLALPLLLARATGAGLDASKSGGD